MANKIAVIYMNSYSYRRFIYITDPATTFFFKQRNRILRVWYADVLD